jgi:hypothetical protein
VAPTFLHKRLEKHLLSKGHRVSVPVGAAVAGNWHTKFSQALVTSDARIVVLSESGLSSKNVVGEIGAARAMDNVKGMPLLPGVSDAGAGLQASTSGSLRCR